MAEITVVFPTLTFGQRGVQTRDDFVQTQEAGQDTLSGSWATAAALLKTQVNAVKDEVNSSRDTTVEASLVAVGAANYKSDWVSNYNTTGYSIGMSVSYTDGFRYVSKIGNNLAEPSGSTDANWYKITSGYQYLSKSADYTAINNQYIKTTGTITITLGTPTFDGATVVIEKIDTTADVTLTIDTQGAETITFKETADTAFTFKTNMRYTFVYDITNNTWRIG